MKLDVIIRFGCIARRALPNPEVNRHDCVCNERLRRACRSNFSCIESKCCDTARRADWGSECNATIIASVTWVAELIVQCKLSDLLAIEVSCHDGISITVSVVEVKYNDAR